MASGPIFRQTVLPPPGRPHWQSGGDTVESELLYLSWGERWMGNSPITQAQHEGWVYAVILDGTPTLLLQESKLKVKRGDVVIFHPDCAYGWTDRPGASCRPMTWLWKTPPAHSQLVPKPGGYVRLKVSDAVLRHVARINRQCQGEVLQAGETAFLSLRRAHLDLDLCLARCLKREDRSNHQHLIKLALAYLRRNPASLMPAKSLCEYLQISSSSLRSLFQKNCGKGPQAVALGLRMQYARQRLEQSRIPVKQVAYELGYHHSNDFSRAYKRYFGKRALQKEK